MRQAEFATEYRKNLPSGFPAIPRLGLGASTETAGKRNGCGWCSGMPLSERHVQAIERSGRPGHSSSTAIEEVGQLPGGARSRRTMGWIGKWPGWGDQCGLATGCCNRTGILWLGNPEASARSGSGPVLLRFLGGYHGADG